MENQITLLVMAGGMGSRFGRLKQLEPIGYDGETFAEFSLYDALRAGFSRTVFIVKPDTREDFEKLILSRLPGKLEITLCEQRMDDLPAGFVPPEGRAKPWGTAHAVWSARDVIRGPFAVINADDFYGPQAFRLLHDHLKAHGDQPGCYAMAGYRLENTVTDQGSVSRGICETDDAQMLTSIVEHTDIRREGGEIVSFLPDGGRRVFPGDTVVSMNAWGFTPQIFPAIGAALSDLGRLDPAQLLRTECYLPTVADRERQAGRAGIRVYPSGDKWYGVTNREDLIPVRQAIRAMIDAGAYPRSLWKEV